MFRRSQIVRSLAYVAAFGVAGCQGSSGTGGLTIPQTGAYGNPQGPTSAQSISRQQVLEGTTEIDPATSQVTLPAIGGFTIVIDASTGPSPGPSGSEAPAAAPASSGSPTPAASSSPASLASPAASSASTPTPAAAGTAAAKNAKSSHAAAKITTKLVIYPDKSATAPTPTPDPSGSPLPSIVARTELAHGTVSFATPLTIAGLAAIHVTIPVSEQVTPRGFTLAVYRAGGKKHQTLVAFDTAAALTKDVVRGSTTAPITFEKGAEYAIELFGDPLPATPAPVGNYPTPGNNPFAPPSGMATGVPGMPGANPNAPATAVPGAGTTPTPYP